MSESGVEVSFPDRRGDQHEAKQYCDDCPIRKPACGRRQPEGGRGVGGMDEVERRHLVRRIRERRDCAHVRGI